MAQFNYNDYVSQEANKTQEGAVNTNSVSYFALKNDGDEAVVRFIYDNPNQFDLLTVHTVQIDGKYKKVSCLRTPMEPLNKCPLCEKGDKLQQKFFVKLIEYVRDEKTNQIIPVAKVWERPASYSKVLNGYFSEVYILSDCIFKIKRHGAKGDMNTTYDTIPANPQVYKPEYYVKDFSAFDNYKLSYIVMEKSYSDLAQFVTTGTFPEEQKQNQPQTLNTPTPGFNQVNPQQFGTNGSVYTQQIDRSQYIDLNGSNLGTVPQQGGPVFTQPGAQNQFTQTEGIKPGRRYNY